MRKLIVLFLILPFLQLSAQIKPEKIKVGALTGYGFYRQEDLKYVNQNVIDQLPFEVRTIDNFKPVLYFGAYAQYQLLSRFYFGPIYEYHYTGSRLGAKDYSGTFSFDQYVHKHQVGLKADYSLIPLTRTVFKIEMDAGANFTSWKMDSKLVIGDNGEYSVEQQDTFKGLSWYISPALKIENRLMPQVYIVGAVGYYFDLVRNYHYEENKDIDIEKTPNWSGLKLYLGLEFNLR